jgi:hypothetical protein
MINYLRRLKLVIRDVLIRSLLFSLGYRLSLPKIARGSKTAFGLLPIYDLANIRLEKASSAIELRTFTFGAPLSDQEPSVAAVTLMDKSLQHYTSVFAKPLLLAAYSQRKKKLVEVDKPVYLLPYNTNHFGHFTGECLGSLIYFSHKLKDNNRTIQFLAPSTLCATIYKFGNANCLALLDPLTLLQNNILFKDAILLPRLTPWQNLALCAEIFCDLPSIKRKQHKVFLTSERSDRIVNIAELKRYLVGKGFYVLNPRDHEFLDTLALVQNAETLITEAGSIMLNIFISRHKPYHCLVSENAKNMSDEDFIGGGVFNAFKLYSASLHYCRPVGTLGMHHPYSNQIEVNITQLQVEMGL